tara:strand:- start:2813 stop:3739 length:927 start_codon:yes stop_codon:yes gene_type:complete
MNKQILSLDSFKYQYSKLKRRVEIFLTKFITFMYKQKLPEEIILIMKKNRNYLLSVEEYLPFSEYDYKQNNYGIQNYIFHKLNEEIELFPTYTDILTLLIKELNQDRLIYLEIGTSVFKNFQQIENNVENATLYGYDINELIQSIKNKYKLEQKKNINTNKKYYHSKGRNEIYYFKDDVLSKDGAQNFKSMLHEKINVVFSDALHTEEGILSEYNNIIKGNLSNNFLILFDDLNLFTVEKGVDKVYKELQTNNPKIKYFSFWTYGWIGQYEKLHKIGIITTFDIDAIFKTKKLKLPLFKEVGFKLPVK